MMRLPFVSRQAFNELGIAHCLLRGRLVKAETAQHAAEALLAAERKLSSRTVAYVKQAEGRRDTDGYRLARALRAIAQLRAEAATQRRVITHLTDQLLDATGYQGEHLYPEARTTLGIDKENA
ncbi:hypothetical protein ACIQ9R_37415 [Streptomyces sp. NPDC094447]|uniref:hypothetical protein n=1 Tax=Streptomyces sp. NPDC094447 TaxID=3366062 RepID=UPI00382989D2